MSQALAARHRRYLTTVLKWLLTRRLLLAISPTSISRVKLIKSLSGPIARFCASLFASSIGASDFGPHLRGRGMRVDGTVESGSQPISFIDRLTSSEGFTVLFREGMTLVEDAAAYLDGEGREEAKALPRAASLAYAAESMRLTTRLMQIASWLLLRRAVNQGEMTRSQAASDLHRVKLSRQDLASNPEVFGALPEKLRQLTIHSMRLQARIIHLDQLIYAPTNRVPESASPVGLQLARLRGAFSAGV